jgi:hypothetical protein
VECIIVGNWIVLNTAMIWAVTSRPPDQIFNMLCE